MLRYLTAGESHGKQLTVILDGIPAGLELKESDIDVELSRRQEGFGRGPRMKTIEKDKVDITSGVRWGRTLGSPICMVIKNLDWNDWKTIMSVDEKYFKKNLQQLSPRPGHADLAGAMKYNFDDLRNVLERASARETAARVAAGAVCRKFLLEFKINVNSFVTEICGVKAYLKDMELSEIVRRAEKSPVRIPDKNAEIRIIREIDGAAKKGDTLGGTFSVVASGVPAGLGSYTQWDRKLDGIIAQNLMSIQAIKGVEFGLGFGLASTLGSQSHDEIFYSKARGFYRETNNAGGIEGGISNGENIVANCVMKPIPSLTKPLRSVNIKTKKVELAEAVRSDICAVPSAAIVAEAVLSFALAQSFSEKFGGDSMTEIKNNFNSYCRQLKKF